MTISLEKKIEEVQKKAPGLVSLVKEAQVQLAKENLVGTKAKVALVLDHSGSMGHVYRSGAMQRLAEKVLAVANGLDDDGDIEFFVFDSNAAYLGEIGLDNYQGAIDNKIKGRHMGTTAYDKAFYTVRDHYNFTNTAKKGLFGFGKKDDSITSTDIPVFAIFLTDGAPDSKPAAARALAEVSKTPIFWKFLSIGSANFSFLEKLDDMEGRFIDNANYQHLGNDVDNINSTELFSKILVEYADWLKEAKKKGLLT